MQFNQLRSLIKDLLHKVCCPHCQRRVEKGKVEVLAAQDSSAVLKVDCPHCPAQFVVNAGIKKRRGRQRAVRTHTDKTNVIRPKDVVAIREALANFSGAKDVRDLF